jgi:hypothetical protein
VAAFSAAAEPGSVPPESGFPSSRFDGSGECYEAAQNELKQCPAFCERLFDRSDPDERRTMDELESYHVDTLKLVVDKASARRHLRGGSGDAARTDPLSRAGDFRLL